MSTAYAFTTAAGNLILNEILSVTNGTRGTVYMALTTTDPGETGVMTGELSGDGYARTAITFGAASGGDITNSAAVIFPEATAAWTGVAYAAIMDASTGGNCLARDSVSGTIASGDVVSFEIGDVDLSNDAGWPGTFWENEVLDWLLRGQSLTKKSFYASLHTNYPVTTANEITFTGYSRQEITSWNTVADAKATPTIKSIQFGPLGGDGVSRAYYMGHWDAASSGNSLWFSLAGVFVIDDGEFLVNGADGWAMAVG